MTAPIGRTRGAYAKTARRKAEIIEAATAVFSVSGYHGGSLRDISREVGVSLTSIVHHFPTKTELLLAVLTAADQRASDILATEPAGVPFRDKILHLVTTNLDRPEMLRLLAVLAAESSSTGHPAHGWFVERYARFAQDAANQIAHDQRRGLIHSDHDPVRLGQLLAAVWDGTQLQWLLDPSLDMVGLMATAMDALFAPGPADADWS